jgi:hypothetical protein
MSASEGEVVMVGDGGCSALVQWFAAQTHSEAITLAAPIVTELVAKAAAHSVQEASPASSLNWPAGHASQPKPEALGWEPAIHVHCVCPVNPFVVEKLSRVLHKMQLASEEVSLRAS